MHTMKRFEGGPIRLVASSLIALLVITKTLAANGDLPLTEAVKARDLQKVRSLLGQKIDVNGRSTDGATALLWAVHGNDDEAADLLIQAGADVNISNDYRMTPLSLACTNGNPGMVARLVKAGANPNTRIATGEPPIMTCAATGNADAVRTLLAYGADVNAAELQNNQTALMWAAAERHPEVVRVLTEAGAELRARSRHGFTALHFAAREGDLESTRLLLAAGIDVNIRSEADASLKGRGPAFDAMRSDGSTPLLVAIVRGNIPLARFLLEQRADPNIDSAGFTPLHWAAATWEGDLSNAMFGFSDPMSGIPDRQAKIDLMKALLARGANPNARVTRRLPGFAGGYAEPIGATPFFLASSVADVEMMQLLLDAGADPAQQTDGKTSALMAAAGVNRKLSESPVTEAQSIEAVTLLLKLGADAGHTSANGENALFGPAYRGWNKLVQLLVDNRVNVNVVSKAGITPWLAASGLGDRFGGVLYNPQTAELLVRLGADPKLGTPCQAQVKCR